jgi:hypothetical protein
VKNNKKLLNYKKNITSLNSEITAVDQESEEAILFLLLHPINIHTPLLLSISLISDLLGEN